MLFNLFELGLIRDPWPIVSVLFCWSFGCIATKTLNHWLSILRVPDEYYFRKASCALILISTFSFNKMVSFSAGSVNGNISAFLSKLNKEKICTTLTFLLHKVICITDVML